MSENTPTQATASDIYDAISIIQSRLPVIEKTATNPHFGSTFTPLEDVARRVYPMLRELGVCCMQPILESDQTNTVKVRTVLRHIESKSEVEAVCVMPSSAHKGQQATHAYGSSVTYARRYSLTAILGIVCGNEDNDGNGPAPSQEIQPEPSSQVQAQGDDQQELERFKAWLKSIAPTKDDAQALCAWLAVDDVPDLTLNAALTQVHVARAVGRAIKTLTSQPGHDAEIIMANARDYWQKRQGGQA